MAALDQETEILVQRAWAPRTLQMFEVWKRSFELFRETMQSPSKKGLASTLEITRFIASLSLNKKAPATISSYVCAISNWHKTQGWPDPYASFMVKTALKGAGRDALPHISSSLYEVKLFNCVFLLAFFGLLRIREMVCQNKYEPTSKVLQINDIAFKKNSIKVTIRFLKTDQKGKSSSLIFQGKEKEKLCPVQGMRNYIARRGQHAGPLFCNADGLFLSRFQFNKVLEQTVEFVDSTIKNIESHSFRIGGATNAIYSKASHTNK